MGQGNESFAYNPAPNIVLCRKFPTDSLNQVFELGRSGLIEDEYALFALRMDDADEMFGKTLGCFDDFFVDGMRCRHFIFRQGFEGLRRE